MAVVTARTFRLVGTVDCEQIVGELADSAEQDIIAFVTAIVVAKGDPEFAKTLAREMRDLADMEWGEVGAGAEAEEEEEDEEA